MKMDYRPKKGIIQEKKDVFIFNADGKTGFIFFPHLIIVFFLAVCSAMLISA